MKNKLPFLLVLALILTGLVINSCKKEQHGTVETLFSSGAWQLASVQYKISVGDTVKLDTLLNTTCDSTQILTFKSDHTCTYTNFNCLPQPKASGQWSLTDNQLFLRSDMVCKDTTATGSSKPFANAQIINVGQYSLVLLTGDIQNYTSTTRRTVIRYGFVRQKAAVQ
jgi:hypothetical protein